MCPEFSFFVGRTGRSGLSRGGLQIRTPRSHLVDKRRRCSSTGFEPSRLAERAHRVPAPRPHKSKAARGAALVEWETGVGPATSSLER